MLYKISLTLLQAVKSYPSFRNSCVVLVAGHSSSMWLTDRAFTQMHVTFCEYLVFQLVYYSCLLDKKYHRFIVLKLFIHTQIYFLVFVTVFLSTLVTSARGCASLSVSVYAYVSVCLSAWLPSRWATHMQKCRFLLLRTQRYSMCNSILSWILTYCIISDLTVHAVTH